MFEVIARQGTARRGRLTTAHGVINTPAFMPVGTAATVKGVLPEQVAASGAEVLLGNTYHLMLRPSAERIAELGGLHRFMNWPGPILTDSGGFQVMSLADLRTVTDEGVSFRSHIDGSRHGLSPERSVEIQTLLGSDITMVLDQCIAYPASESEAEAALALSTHWAARSKAAFQARAGYGLFGIVQGSTFAPLRRRSAEALTDIGFDGYAIGGLAVGEPQEIMFEVIEATEPHLPADRPRYLMGVGKPGDLVGAVRRGVDMFDCVLPTRSGRTGQAFTRRGALNLRNARHKDDPRPLDEACGCPACASYARAYLHHLIRSGEMLGAILLTLHNLHYYQDLMAGLRAAIEAGSLDLFAESFARDQADGDLPPL